MGILLREAIAHLTVDKANVWQFKRDGFSSKEIAAAGLHRGGS